ncbi:MAG: hypothetical protein EXX96DRAFT_566801 [Benjaminiella poitrasii]|nr:MAG: hypothetical protein EXX96DRAFT_566801 [Benjaminiella poitrasii]
MSEAKVVKATKNVRNISAMQNRKTVYKSVLGSPFILKWPTIHPDLGQTILTQLSKTLEPLGEYKRACRAIKGKKEETKTIDEPELRKRVHIGINKVTRFMETFIENKQANKDACQSSTPTIYICKREIKPLQLCQHLLYMAALANVKLVPMPADAEKQISQALGIKRSCVVLIEIIQDKEESLRLSAKEVPSIEAPWLSNALSNPAYYRPDNVKTLKTTTPIVKKNQQQNSKDLKRKVDADTDTDSNNRKKSKN